MLEEGVNRIIAAKDIYTDDGLAIAQRLQELAVFSGETEGLTFTQHVARLTAENSTYNGVINALLHVDALRQNRIGSLLDIQTELSQEEVLQIEELRRFLKKNGIDIPVPKIYISRHLNVTAGSAAARIYPDSEDRRRSTTARSTIFMQPPKLGNPVVATKITHYSPDTGLTPKYELWEGFAQSSLYLPPENMLLNIVFPGRPVDRRIQGIIDNNPF